MFKLRELEESDLEIINKWRNKHSLIDNLGAPFRYINLDVEKQIKHEEREKEWELER